MKTNRSLGWALAILALGVPVHLIATGCGSESSGSTPPAADGGLGNDAAGTGLGNVTGCDPATKECTTPTGTCGGIDFACTSNLECCTLSCVGGKCSGKQCIADSVACTADGECCGGKCATTCTPLSTSCKSLGNPCAGDGECCSKSCKGGLCSSPSFCAQTGDTCAADLDCCGGLCTKAAGAALGLCGLAEASGVGSCTPAGQVCGSATTGGALPNCGGECCSRSCRPYAPTGAIICQPPSGCHPTGELCQSDADCCGSPGSPGSTGENNGMPTDVRCSKAPGATVGRCDNGKVCSPAGAICRLAANECNATDRCCSGTVQTHPLNCKQDSLGIPRCTAESDYDCAAKGPPPPGTACATSADCCNMPCVPNPAGAGFVCSATACVPVAGACTTTADCCAGSPCNIAAGATKGTCGPSGVTGGGGTGGTPPPPGGTTCAQYGQQCTQSANCCDGVPCSGGFCVFPGPN